MQSVGARQAKTASGLALSRVFPYVTPHSFGRGLNGGFCYWQNRDNRPGLLCSRSLDCFAAFPRVSKGLRAGG